MSGRGSDASLTAAREASLRRLHALVGNINGDLDLERTLDAVCRGIVDGLGFQVAVVNLVLPDGDLEVVAVAGSAEARAALLGQRGSRADWDGWLGDCAKVGNLLVDYRRQPSRRDAVPTWIPESPVSDDENAWHPLDSLIAPLETSRSGLLATISVDLPVDGQRPGPEQLELLEMYAAQASVAIENAALHTALVARDAEKDQVVGRLSALVSEAPVAIVELDLEGKVRLWNPAAETMFGWRAQEVLGGPNPSVDTEAYGHRLAALAGGQVDHRVAARRTRKDGSPVDVEMSSAVLRADDGTPFGYIGVMADVTERVQLEGELRSRAFSDPLTGLANRAMLHERMAATDAGTENALLLLDLDGFKSVNDSLGHGSGDLVLLQVADRLRRSVRPADVVARLGGDEFVVLVRGGEERAVPLAERLVRLLAEPVEVGGRQVTLGASIGISYLTSVDAAASEGALRDADIAMYAAKARGKGCAQVFAAPLREAVVEQARLADDLRTAVAAGEFAVRYHPMIDLVSGEIVGFEALVRWNHPERGELSPALFIPLAEHSGAIVGIGAWVLGEACRQLRRWQDELPQDALYMSVNLSPVQLRTPGLVEQVQRVLAETGIAPALLVLELTETVLVEQVELALDVLDALRQIGVRIALDDFGAGYSSLRYLKRLPFDIVKLDRELIDGVDQDPAALGLVDAVLSLLDRLGLYACAEGIETVAQFEALRGLGCRLGQGFVICQPLLPHEVPALLAGHTCALVTPQAPRGRLASPA